MSEQFTVFVFVVISVIVAMMIPVFLVAAAVRRTMRMQQEQSNMAVAAFHDWMERMDGAIDRAGDKILEFEKHKLQIALDQRKLDRECSAQEHKEKMELLRAQQEAEREEFQRDSIKHGWRNNHRPLSVMDKE